MMYEDYALEARGESCFKTEHGFIFYKYEGNICFIGDMYVVPAKRGSGYAHIIMDLLADKAKRENCYSIIMHIWQSSYTKEQALKAALKNGFKIDLMKDGFIQLRKDL